MKKGINAKAQVWSCEVDWIQSKPKRNPKSITYGKEQKGRKRQMQMRALSQIIRNEAIACRKSSDDMRNTPDRREIFWVVSIVLDGIADKLEQGDAQTALQQLAQRGEGK